MSDLVEFANRVKAILADAAREPRWDAGVADSYMAGVAKRREQFERLASRLNEALIQPRLATVAGCFANASLAKDDPIGRCSCWFGYCDRFPASTRVAFAVEHDLRLENVVVCFEASMTPVFVKLHDHDNLTALLDNVNDDSVADWVEERLLDFLAAYLQIDRGGEDFDEEVATDPVCGMRINRASAAATNDSYRGHAYYFCSTECRDRFVRDPTAYVQVIPM